MFSLVPRRRALRVGDWKFWPYRFRNVSEYHLPISVCRYWHRTALNTPALWADVCILNEQVSNYRNVHQRFPDCPLNLFIERDNGPWRSRTLRLLRTHGTRIRLLHVVAFDGKFGQQALNTICSLPAQELLHCAVLLRKARQEERTKVLFAGHGADLRSLLLDGLPFLPSNAFPALRRLILLPPVPMNWDMSDLLTFLSRLPSLERFHLNLSYNGEQRVATDLPFITLNVLRTLSIEAHTSPSDDFLTMVRDLYTHVSLPTIDHRAVDVKSINDFPPLEACLVAPPGASFTEFMVYPSSFMMNALRFGREDRTQTMTFRYKENIFENAGDITALLSTSSLFSAVQECWIMALNDDIYKHIEKWIASLPFLHQLRGLVFADSVSYSDMGSTREIVRYLTHTPDTPASCHLLDTLCLRIQGGRQHYSLAVVLAQLSDMLRSRREAGFPIHQVVLGFLGKADPNVDIDAKLRKMDGLADELVWYWDVGRDFDWLRRVPCLLSSTLR